jgi:WD40 repeat protein
LIQESPTRELVSDCSRFVTQHFEVISASSPHIYHSALVLTPRESKVYQLYQSHGQPFVRVVKGAPEFWNSHVAVAKNPSEIKLAIWSPCNRFIAISPGRSKPVDILDPATLQPLQSLEFSQEMPLQSAAMAFSPDSRTLTSLIFGKHPDEGGWSVVSWDLQTGGAIGVIEWRGKCDTFRRVYSIAYSMNGKLVAILSGRCNSVTISIYDVVSGVYMHDVYHPTPRNRRDRDKGAKPTIWTDGESLRFTVSNPSKIAVWKVGFTPGATPVEVETISIPNSILEILSERPPQERGEFHPPSYRILFLPYPSPLVVWDARTSIILLQEPIYYPGGLRTFSSNGRCFACTQGSEVHIWEESSNGYSVFKKFIPNKEYSTPLLSPNGESIIAFGGPTIQLWHTQSITPHSSRPTPKPGHLLEFHPDQPLAVTAPKNTSTVTVVDLNTGVSQLTIDTSVQVRGLGLIGNTIVVIGDSKVITWNLPGWKFPPGIRINYEDSARTIDLNKIRVATASTSFDFQYIGFTEVIQGGGSIEVHCTFTGQTLRHQAKATALWFAPGGHDLWCATGEAEATVLTVTQDTLDHTKTVPKSEYGKWGCPWGSSRGYQITSEGWVLRQDGKRLLMLPPLWRSSFQVEEEAWRLLLQVVGVAWNGKFLALLHELLPEPVILELEP